MSNSERKEREKGDMLKVDKKMILIKETESCRKKRSIINKTVVFMVYCSNLQLRCVHHFIDVLSRDSLEMKTTSDHIIGFSDHHMSSKCHLLTEGKVLLWFCFLNIQISIRCWLHFLSVFLYLSRLYPSYCHIFCTAALKQCKKK